MTREQVETEFLSTRTTHPLTGFPTHRGFSPEHSNKAQNPETHRMVLRYGQICETAAIKAWTSPLSENVDLQKASLLVRQALSPLREKVLRRNYDVVGYYQGLTLPPEIYFGGDERTVPSWEPLKILFEEADKSFAGGLMDNFYALGAEYPGSDTIHPRIRIVTEMALILSRLALEKQTPFSTSKLFPDIWFPRRGSYASTQFDAVLLPADTECTNSSELEAYITQGHPWHILEIKVDFHVRNTTGPINRLDKGPFDRHLVEMQEKIAKMVSAGDAPTPLPDGITFVYLRGTMPHAIHHIALNNKFLSDWRFGLLLSMSNGYLTDEQSKTANRLLGLIDSKLKELKGKAPAPFIILGSPATIPALFRENVEVVEVKKVPHKRKERKKQRPKAQPNPKLNL